MSRDSITGAIIMLLQESRFYGEMVLTMNIRVTHSVPTAGVCIKDKVELHINPTFFDALTPKERVAVLKHECAHLLNDHIPRSKVLAPEAYQKSDKIDGIINQMKHYAINIAADAAINPGIPNIGKDCIFPSQFGMPNGHTMEDYFIALKEQERQGKNPFAHMEGPDDSGSCKGTPKKTNVTRFDDHPLWSESEGDHETLREKIKQHVKQASKAAGSVSYSDQVLIDRLLHTPKDWKSDLKRFAAKSMNIILDSSRKKRNRRYGVQYPGNIKVELLHIGVAIDTSGSISEEALTQFMAEIGNIAKYAKVTVLEADAEVKNSYEFDPKKTYAVSGRGGTAYQPAFDYFNKETEVDGVIYMGDMDCFDKEEIKKPAYPVLWAIVGDQDPPVSWGSRTKIEVKRKS